MLRKQDVAQGFPNLWPMTASQCLFYIWYLPAHIVAISLIVKPQVSAVINFICKILLGAQCHQWVRPRPFDSVINAPTRWDGPAGAGGGGVGDGTGHSSGSQALRGHLVEVSGRMQPQTVSCGRCEFQLESFRKQQRGERHRKQSTNLSREVSCALKWNLKTPVWKV